MLLYLDMDVDAFPHTEQGWQIKKSNWQQSIEAFMASDALFSGSPDHSSPVNTGVFLVKPREWLFRAAVRCLRSCWWEPKLGFDSVGAPQNISNNVPLLRRLAAGFAPPDATGSGWFRSARPTKVTYRQAWVADTLRRSEFYKQNNWLFVGGNLDQGLFFYLVYLRYGVGTWNAKLSNSKMYVHHFWGARARYTCLAPGRPIRGSVNIPTRRNHTPILAGPGKPWEMPRGGNAKQVCRPYACLHAPMRNTPPQTTPCPLR